MILEQAKTLSVSPNLGMRVRLTSTYKRCWQNAGGEHSKFGLSAMQVSQALDLLRDYDALYCLKLLHFHIGSQISDLADYKTGLREAVRYYVDLVNAGCNIQLVDVGGGLGIDYEGLGNDSRYSMNYTIQNYASCIVESFKQATQAAEIEEPTLITEAGRALTAHHTVLITEVIDIERADWQGDCCKPDLSDPPECRQLYAIHQTGKINCRVQNYEQAYHLLNKIQSLHAVGRLSLSQRAMGEVLFRNICRQLLSAVQSGSVLYTDLSANLQRQLADKLICNFSIFQSAPDIWGIEQVFPVMPLHHLDKRPTRFAILQDLTCDSDGQIETYVGEHTQSKSLPVHMEAFTGPYLLGVFLLGAYQEVLGDMHNLFGDTHAVNVCLTGDGYNIGELQAGDIVSDLLAYLNFDTTKMRERLMSQIRQTGSAPLNAELMREVERLFESYTYVAN